MFKHCQQDYVIVYYIIRVAPVTTQCDKVAQLM